MTSPEPTQTTKASPTAATAATAVAAPIVLALFSTALAVALHEGTGAPGDHPLTLLIIGCVTAFAVGASGIAPGIHVGLAALAGFPLEAILDLALHGGHTLLPFEFAFYGLYLALGVAAALLGRSIGVTFRFVRRR
jgi:hypothetical protein